MITNYKITNSFINFLISWISARTAPELLSIKVECIFVFLILLIIALRNSSANFWFEIFSFLIPLPEADLSRLAYVAKVADRANEADFLSNQKIYRSLKQVRVDIHHVSDF